MKKIMNYNNYIRSEWALHSQTAVYVATHKPQKIKVLKQLNVLQILQ